MLLCRLGIYNAFGKFGKGFDFFFCSDRGNCRQRGPLGQSRDAGCIGSVSALSHSILLFPEHDGAVHGQCKLDSCKELGSFLFPEWLDSAIHPRIGLKSSRAVEGIRHV